MLETMRQQSLETPAFRGVLAFCSNMDPTPVFQYPTVEHAYQAAKSSDQAVRERIRAAATPQIAKCMGNPKHRLCVIPTVRADWEEIKLAVMRALVREKFVRHPSLARLLLATGDLALVERNLWRDRFWGVWEGRGENHLGRILMDVRAELTNASPAWRQSGRELVAPV